MYGGCHVGDPVFFVCEHVKGGNFFTLFEKDKSHLWRLFYSAALGLRYLHENKVVHGDLKCNNILVNGDTAKICDFGFSYVRERSDMSLQAQTKQIRWKAPEALMALDQNLNPRFASDLFSFGMCIIEAFLDGEPTYGLDNDDTIIEKILDRKKSNRAGVTKSLEAGVAEPSPTIHAQQSTHTQHLSRQREPNTSLDELLAAMAREEPAPIVPSIEETAPEHRYEQLQSELVAVLARKLHLLTFYISQGDGTKRKRPATAEPSGEPRIYRPVPPAPSDILSNTHGQGDQRSGEVPSQFIELTISSHATSFKPHPAVLMCLYDFRFGVRGLSVGHLERFDLAARQRWRRETTVNMNNFPTSVNFPEPCQSVSMVELQDSLSLLIACAKAFYN
ncbi:Serine/threonine protein kinase [Phytophthora megakarya]|uniref:Serine/threonine protein kinase n=1 Tax=Phytophthora megakarya TaxID=4795 RepID=A0A225W3F5_9STRA|nr:Serine/threonine protein kinase [Phytophthora megakarya]